MAPLSPPPFITPNSPIRTGGFPPPVPVTERPFLKDRSWYVERDVLVQRDFAGVVDKVTKIFKGPAKDRSKAFEMVANVKPVPDQAENAALPQRWMSKAGNTTIPSTAFCAKLQQQMRH